MIFGLLVKIVSGSILNPIVIFIGGFFGFLVGYALIPYRKWVIRTIVWSLFLGAVSGYTYQGFAKPSPAFILEGRSDIVEGYSPYDELKNTKYMSSPEWFYGARTPFQTMLIKAWFDQYEMDCRITLGKSFLKTSTNYWQGVRTQRYLKAWRVPCEIQSLLAHIVGFFAIILLTALGTRKIKIRITQNK